MSYPPALCECGCGALAPIAIKTRARLGHVKGRPCRFIRGHNSQVGNAPNWRGGKTKHQDGYVCVRMPNHARASNTGYVLAHVVIAEHALGHPLPSKAQVHHHNEVKSDNTGGNLVICENEAYHKLLHKRKRAYLATGNPSILHCYICKQYDASLARRTNGKSWHAECANVSQRNLKARNHGKP